LNLFYQPDIINNTLHLTSEESRHAIKVLRYKMGDEIDIIDGKGSFYTANITDPNARKCGFEIKTKKTAPQRSHYIHIAIAPTKNIDRIEWFIEKSVEFGVDEISLVICDNSERKIVKTDRLERKAISAMKQSIKATLPVINEPIVLKTLINSVTQEEKYIAFVDYSNPIHLMNLCSKESNYCVLIGPEGDFSEKELEMAINHDFKKVSLGNSRLRTETAGISACHILNLING